MANEIFKASRENGMSDREVIFDLVKDAEPGQSFTYDEFLDALKKDTARRITITNVYLAARAANKSLLARNQRCLMNVPGMGYRIAQSEEHLPLARRREDKASRQIRQGVEILKHCKLEELTPTQRALHQGQLLVLSGLYTNLQSMNKRVNDHEALIADLVSRVNALSPQTAMVPAS